MPIAGKAGWYGVRTHYWHPDIKTKSRDHRLFEERVVVFRAGSLDEAIEMAEMEAEKYCEDLGGPRSAQYLGLAEAFGLPEDRIKPGTEVFSLMRESLFEPESYLTAFFDTGTERST